MKKSGPNDYVIRIVDDPAQIDAPAWDALLDQQDQPTLFMRHAYLAALHTSASATASTGWRMSFVLVERDGQLAAACPLYLKSHSWGEYVFDWSWAKAFERAGGRYYPKAVCAVPFTPVPGSRLLAVSDEARTRLVSGIEALAQHMQLSSVHLLFGSDANIEHLERRGWLVRRGVQFHWQLPQALASQPHRNFECFLALLNRDKRKKIQQERRRVIEAGITFRVLQGQQIQPADWQLFYRCYSQTYAEHGAPPYLTEGWVQAMAATMPEAWVLFVASRDNRDIACSLIAVDRKRLAAYGRYWGALEHVPLLHFEACYYQPLAWCIEQGFERFEGGAQGEHKMARGLLPTPTCSAHWIAHPGLQTAVRAFVQEEGADIGAYVNELHERSPYKKN